MIFPMYFSPLESSIMQFVTVCWETIVPITKFVSLPHMQRRFVFLVEFVCLSATLLRSYVWTAMKFYRRVLGDKRKNWLTFGSNLILLGCENEQKKTLWLYHVLTDVQVMIHQCHTFINAYCQAVTNLADWHWGLYEGNDLPHQGSTFIVKLLKKTTSRWSTWGQTFLVNLLSQSTRFVAA